MIKYLLPLMLALPVAAQPVRVVTEDFPPFQNLYNGTIQGPMYSIMRQICKEAKLQCTFELLAWKDAYKQAVDGDADVVFSILLEVPERADLFYLSPSIVNTSYSFFVTSRNPWKYGGVSTLDGMTIGAYGPSGTSIVAEEVVAKRAAMGFKPTPLIIEPSIVLSYQNLITGKYGANGAVVVNKEVGYALLKKHSIIGPKEAGEIKKITYGFGVSRKAKNPAMKPTEIYERMTGALERLQKRGEVLDTLRFYGLKATQ
jgi:polar amino acid transport system substrate-binding protein